MAACDFKGNAFKRLQVSSEKSESWIENQQLVYFPNRCIVIFAAMRCDFKYLSRYKLLASDYVVKISREIYFLLDWIQWFQLYHKNHSSPTNVDA